MGQMVTCVAARRMGAWVLPVGQWSWNSDAGAVAASAISWVAPPPVGLLRRFAPAMAPG